MCRLGRYDKAGRLASWENSTTTTSCEWDAAGNRTKAEGVTETYDERNRLVAQRNTHYGYTAHGALASIESGKGDQRRLTSGGGLLAASDGKAAVQRALTDRHTDVVRGPAP
ncbi:hypothetical protein AB0B50_01620 [Streptomyces sp. NPDC041068]|uniref:hypothetical protein n=1 Tax=Streptomyces sp. NPDC041068 TaxID=3155130 RepID=UPI0033E7D5DB